MLRRDFTTLLGSAACTTLVAAVASAQSAGKIPRIGILWHAGSADEEAIYLKGNTSGLERLRLYRRQEYHTGKTAFRRSSRTASSALPPSCCPQRRHSRCNHKAGRTCSSTRNQDNPHRICFR